LGNSGSRRPLRQTALLASRALIDDLLVVGVLKVALGRQRPPGDSFGGPPDGIRSGDYRSLPSGHASAVWTMASVISSRHRQRWVPFVLYGFAGAVSITRVTSGRHFYGDVVPGALIGCSIGKMVVRRSQANP
jgi:undecaprenyl-diphosphatase